MGIKFIHDSLSDYFAGGHLKRIVEENPVWQKSLDSLVKDKDIYSRWYSAFGQLTELASDEQQIDELIKWGENWQQQDNLFGLDWLPRLYLYLSRYDDLETLLTKLEFLEVKTQAEMLYDLVTDFAKAVTEMPPGRPHHRILYLLEEAIRRDIHFIAQHIKDYPQALFQCLWNSCWWYDCPNAIHHYKESERRLDHGELPWEQKGPKLHKLMEDWRYAKENNSPGFVWVRSLRPPFLHLGASQIAVFYSLVTFVQGIAITPNSQFIISGSGDGIVRVWEARTGKQVRCLRGHRYPVESVAVSPDGECIASASRDKTVRVWRLATSEELQVLSGHKDEVSSVVFSSDGRYIVTGSHDKTVRVWNVKTGAEVLCLLGHKSWVSSVAVSPDGRQIASGASDGTMRLWDITDGSEFLCVRTKGHNVSCLAWCPNGKSVLIALTDNTLYLLDADSGEEFRHFTGHEDDVGSVAWSPDCRTIASGSRDLTVRVWDTESGKQLRCLRGHRMWVMAVAYSPDGHLIVSASEDGTVRLWDAQSSAQPLCINGHTGLVTALMFSPDGRWITSGSFDHTVGIWNTEDGTMVKRLQGHKGAVNAVGYSPDGKRIASESTDSTVRVWDAQTGDMLHCLSGEARRAAISECCTYRTRGHHVDDSCVKGEATRFALCRAGIETVISIRLPGKGRLIGKTVAWFPTALSNGTTHPSGRIWALASGNQPYIIRLEGTVK